jgi:hypothetical protein
VLLTNSSRAIAASIKEFELKKIYPKTPIGVTENNSHGETSVQTFFKTQAGSQIRRWGDLSTTRSAGGKSVLEVQPAGSGYTKCDKLRQKPV